MNTHPSIIVSLALACGLPAQGSQSPLSDAAPSSPFVVQKPGDSALLLSAGAGPELAIPGVAGRLELHLPSLVTVPGFAGFGPGLVPSLRTLPGGAFTYQQLTQGTLSHPARVSLGAGFEQQDDVADCTRRALRFVDSVRGTLAPNWMDASVGPARAMHRPDVRGVAYYEFEVRPEGFVVVATGEHDHPIAHWNHMGSAIGRNLEQMAALASKPIAKVYKLDTLCYAAVDPHGQWIGSVGNVPDKLVADASVLGGYGRTGWASLAELEAGFAAAYKPMIENLRLRAAPAWLAERAGEAAVGPMDWSPWVYSWAGSSSEQRLYNQYSYGGCVTGCGATAWAMLFGWVDVKAAQGDARWRYRTGFYRANGSVTGDASVVAPRYMDSGVRTMIQEIRARIATFCLLGNGATFPGDMEYAQGYLSSRTAGRVSTHYSSVGIHWDDLRDRVIEQISGYRTPAIIGTGWLSHYPLAYGYASRYQDVRMQFYTVRVWSRWFYVNQGWGGSGDGWVEASTWFSGRVFPS